MANQNNPTKPPGQAESQTPAPESDAAGRESDQQRSGGVARERPDGGANRPPQEGL